MESLVKFIRDLIIPGITVITGALVAYLNFSVSDVETQLKETREVRAERESRQSFDLKIYDKVVESLESHDQRKQQVAKALVVVMASPELRDNLLAVLEQAGTDTLRKQVAKIIQSENKFKVEESAIPVTPAMTAAAADWKSYNYDIFWCEQSGPGGEAFAQQVMQALKENGATGRLRVRQLPASVNARAGYQISGYVIRANQNESKIAEALRKRAGAVLGTDFVVTFSGQDTPLYISCFICP